ncbi:MAG: hypothetical protein ACOZB3_11200 [Calditrichota bacterium]
MYARMGWLAVVLAVVAGFVMVGCEEEDQSPRDSPPLAPSIQIVMDSELDTIEYYPGQVATAKGLVLVLDGDGQGIAQVKVTLLLTEPFGSIEFLDPILRDTTDESGRVPFRFRAEQTGVQTINAYCAGRRAEKTIVVRDGPPYLHITVDPDTLILGPGLPDSSLVTVCWYGFPLPSFGFNYGEGTFRFVSEDSTNYLAGWWFPECCGTRCFIVMARDLNGNPISGIPTIPVCVFADSLR